MRRTRACGWRTWLCLGAAAWAGGCSRQDADRMARAGHQVVRQVDQLTGGGRQRLAVGWQAVRGSFGDATVDGRVATRLLWEQALAGTRIRVVRRDRGVVELQGTVSDLAQRRRAVELAQATVGVEKVLDALEIE